MYPIQKTYKKSLFNLDALPGNVLVLGDAHFEELSQEPTVFSVIQLDDYKKYPDLTKELTAAIDTENFSSALVNYQESLKSSGVILFIGSFLGLVFLLATGSIIFFKMLTEAEEDRSKYRILYKVGVSKQDMRRTVRCQMGLIFMGPLVLGMIHEAVALSAFSNLLSMNLLKPVLWWMLAYTLIYLIYYFVTTKRFYQTIIKEEN